MTSMERKKLLVFAHVPPPHHGQAAMVELMLRGLGENSDLQVYHVDARFSTDIDDVGRGKLRKLLLLGKYAAMLVALRILKRPNGVYFVPAPGKRIAIYRDLALIGLAKALGMPRIFHWHAGGLADWVRDTARPWERFLCKWVYGRARLSVIPVGSEQATAGYFKPERLEKIPNGIPDPCPDFESAILPARQERLRQRRSGERHVVRVLFMGHCTEDKGLFDVMEAVQLANRRSREAGQSWVFALQVFGKFMTDSERGRFDALRKAPEWAMQAPEPLLAYAEFVSGSEKARVFCESDVLCFPSFYAAEVIPTVILDALAYGLPVIGTKWRGIPELLPPGGLPPCEIRRPDQVAGRLLEVPELANFRDYREWFETHFTVEKFIGSLREVFAEAGEANLEGES